MKRIVELGGGLRHGTGRCPVHPIRRRIGRRIRFGGRAETSSSFHSAEATFFRAGFVRIPDRMGTELR